MVLQRLQKAVQLRQFGHITDAFSRFFDIENHPVGAMLLRKRTVSHCAFEIPNPFPQVLVEYQLHT